MYDIYSNSQDNLYRFASGKEGSIIIACHFDPQSGEKSYSTN